MSSDYRNPKNGQYINAKEYIDTSISHLESSVTAKLESLEKLMLTKFIAEDKALELANAAFEKRMDSTNEWRKTVEDITRDNITCVEFNSYKELIRLDKFNTDKKIDELIIANAKIDGKASQSQASLSILVSILGMLISMLGLVVHFFIK